MLKKLRRLHSGVLIYFMTVAEERSFRAAARRLHIAPSALSRHVLLLEEHLEMQLFERTPGLLKLTAAGEVLLEHCSRTLRDFERACEMLDALRHVQSGRVRIASSESFAAEFVPELCSKFSERHPGIDLRVSITSSEQVFALTERDEVDVGLAFGAPEARRCEVVASFDLPLGALVGREHPLADRQEVTLAECLGHPLVYPGANLSVREKLDEITGYFDAGHEGGIESTSPRLMIGVARLNRHVTFLTPFGIARDLARGELVFVPVRDLAGRPDKCVLVSSFGEGERHAARRFLDFAAVELAEHVADLTRLALGAKETTLDAAIVQKTERNV